MKAVGVLAAIASALALQTTLVRFLPGGAGAFDLALVVVVVVALKSGPVSGMLAGSAAGLVQDALSIGVIGIGGLAQSIVGFAVGAIGRQFILTAQMPRLLVFFGASLGHAAVFMGLYALLGLGSFPAPLSGALSQALGNTVAGMIVFVAIEVVPAYLGRRRLTRLTRQ